MKQMALIAKAKAFAMVRRSPGGIALISAFLLFMNGAWANDLPRVASASTCADQYLLALADRKQIVSVTWQATGPLSFYADKAKGLPTNRRALEEFLALDVDIVLLDRHDAPQLQRVLEEFGVNAINLPILTTFDEIYVQMIHIGSTIGQEAHAMALVADMKRRLAVIKGELGAEREKPNIVYFRPDGGGAGSGTFVNTVLEAAGFENHQNNLGYAGWRGVPMERLILSPPEGGVTSFFDTAHDGITNRFGTHPFYRQLAADQRLLPISGKLWPCAGPMLVDAVEELHENREQVLPVRNDEK